MANVIIGDSSFNFYNSVRGVEVFVMPPPNGLVIITSDFQTLPANKDQIKFDLTLTLALIGWFSAHTIPFVAENDKRTIEININSIGELIITTRELNELNNLNICTFVQVDADTTQKLIEWLAAKNYKETVTNVY